MSAWLANAWDGHHVWEKNKKPKKLQWLFCRILRMAYIYYRLADGGWDASKLWSRLCHAEKTLLHVWNLVGRSSYRPPLPRESFFFLTIFNLSGIFVCAYWLFSLSLGFDCFRRNIFLIGANVSQSSRDFLFCFVSLPPGCDGRSQTVIRMQL